MLRQKASDKLCFSCRFPHCTENSGKKMDMKIRNTNHKLKSNNKI